MSVKKERDVEDERLRGKQKMEQKATQKERGKGR